MRRWPSGSYPGCVSSTDDFYMMDHGLTVMDTSLEVLNPNVYNRISEDPKQPRTGGRCTAMQIDRLPRFLHVMAVNRVAKTGPAAASRHDFDSV